MAEKTHTVHVELIGDSVTEFFGTLCRINATIEDAMTQGEYIALIWSKGQRIVTDAIKEIEEEQAYC